MGQKHNIISFTCLLEVVLLLKICIYHENIIILALSENLASGFVYYGELLNGRQLSDIMSVGNL